MPQSGVAIASYRRGSCAREIAARSSLTSALQSACSDFPGPMGLAKAYVSPLQLSTRRRNSTSPIFDQPQDEVVTFFYRRLRLVGGGAGQEFHWQPLAGCVGGAGREGEVQRVPGGLDV